MQLTQTKQAILSALAPSSTEALRRPPPDSSAPGLPSGRELEELLSLRFGDPIGEFLESALFAPIQDLTGRSAKQVRARLVELGFHLASPRTAPDRRSEERCRQAARIVEWIHAGSLIVDDIEDGSKVRRGEPALHCRYGLPLALNAGNWLYFWPFQISKQMGLSESQELLLYRSYHLTLLRAHFGQALDLGVRIDCVEQARVPGIVLSAMELKTGALIAFALALGGILGGAPAKLMEALSEFGHGFGVGLQMFDDLGNLSGRVQPAKRFEDLSMLRPSWVWACAARMADRDYAEFVAAVRKLPETVELESWLRRYDLCRAGKEEALAHFGRVMAKLKLDLGREADPKTLEDLNGMVHLLERAYG